MSINTDRIQYMRLLIEAVNNDNECVQFGDVKHAYNIGNNCEYPIQIVTKDQIIDFGRLKSNTDICRNIKHISVADNDGQNINNKRIQLNAA